MSGSDNVTVELRGNDADLQNALNRSVTGFKNYANTIDNSLKSVGPEIAQSQKAAIDESTAGINNYAKYVKTAIAGIVSAIAVREIFQFAGSSLAAYREAEEAEGRLERIMRRRGEAIGLSNSQLSDMAARFQDVNAIEGDAVTSAQAAVAVYENVNGQQFVDALQMGADVAAQTGDDFEAEATKVAQALNDPIKGIRTLRELGVTFTEAQQDQIEKLQETGDYIGAQKILLEELGAVYGGSAAEKASEFGSRVNQLSFMFGDAQEAIGKYVQNILEMFLPAGEEVLSFFLNLSESLASSSEGFSEYGDTIGEYVGNAFKYIVLIITDSLSYIQIAWENYTKFVERMVYSFLLTVVSSYEEIKYWLTEAIPGYLDWFAHNWQDIFLDIANFTATVFTNMWTNVYDFFTSLWKMLSGEEASFKFTALTEGFESSLQELPNIAERQLSDTEKYLQESITDLDKQMAESATSIFEGNRTAVEKMFERKVEPEVEIKPKVNPQKLHEAEDKDKKKKKSDKDKDKKDAEDAAKDKEKAEKTLAGSTTDLAKLADQVQEAALKAANEIGEIKPPTLKLSKEELEKQEEIQKKYKELQQSMRADKEAGEKESSRTQDLKDELEDLMGIDDMRMIQFKQKELREEFRKAGRGGNQRTQILQDELAALVGQHGVEVEGSRTVQTEAAAKDKGETKEAAQPKQDTLAIAISQLVNLNAEWLPKIEFAARTGGGLI